MKLNQQELHDYVEKKQQNICGIVALKDGKTVFEDYWHDFCASDTLHVMSATKSIVSLLIGIAIDLRLIKNVQ